MAFSVNTLFMFYLFLSFYGFVLTSSNICHQRSPCKCIYEDGTGIDISVLNGGDSKSNIISSIGSPQYFLHVCSNVPLNPPIPPANGTVQDCKVTSLCLGSQETGYKNLGSATEAKFEFSDGVQSIVYEHNKTITTISLICVQFPETHLLPDDSVTEFNATSHKLILYTSAACITVLEEYGMNGFAMFILILLFLMFAYVVIGIVVKRFMLGARGIEMLPNIEFWSQVPRRLMSGIEFCRNGCRQAETETRPLNPNSYDAI